MPFLSNGSAGFPWSPDLAVGKGSRRIPLSRLLADTWPDIDAKDLYAAVLCGEIRINDERIRDPKCEVPQNARIEWLVEKYVGRGGFKLEGALEGMGLDPSGLICLDAGASTGGFTDCLLSRGAAFVHAVDVGYNQLAWKLRSDSRVSSLERTNIMSLDPDDLDPQPVLAVADLSFRSLRGAASKLLELTGGGTVLALVKPQFEDQSEDGFDGVVRSREVRSAVLKSLRADLPAEGVHVHDAVASPVKGRKGNAEVFFRLSSHPSDNPEYVDRRIESALDSADQPGT